MYTDFTFTYVSDQLNTKQPSAPVFSGSFSHLLACRPNEWSIMVSELIRSIPAQVMVEISGANILTGFTQYLSTLMNLSHITAQQVFPDSEETKYAKA